MMNVLVVDIGGNNVKLRLGAGEGVRRIPSGPTLQPTAMVEAIRAATQDWQFDRITIGCPGPVRDERLLIEPVNLGKGWVGFDFAAAFAMPVKLVNDAAMQALGSYEGGKMLFLGLGTGLGTALVANDVVLSLELGHLPYRRGRTFEDYAGTRGYKRLGKKGWHKAVVEITQRLKAATVADYVVLGGGNAKRLDTLPPDCRAGDNSRAFVGGLRLWDSAVKVL